MSYTITQELQEFWVNINNLGYISVIVDDKSKINELVNQIASTTNKYVSIPEINNIIDRGKIHIKKEIEDTNKELIKFDKEMRQYLNSDVFKESSIESLKDFIEDKFSGNGVRKDKISFEIDPDYPKLSFYPCNIDQLVTFYYEFETTNEVRCTIKVKHKIFYLEIYKEIGYSMKSFKKIDKYNIIYCNIDEIR